MMKDRPSNAAATAEACARGSRDVHAQRRAIGAAINYYLNKTGNGAPRTSTCERRVSMVLRAFRTPVNCRAGGECSNGRAVRYRALGSRGVFIVTSASSDLLNRESPAWTRRKHSRHAPAHRSVLTHARYVPSSASRGCLRRLASAPCDHRRYPPLRARYRLDWLSALLCMPPAEL
jgi:hypothetical protein